MARTRKQGLDYFPFDVDFFSHPAVVCVRGDFGSKGESALLHLLCAVYRNGYFLEWTEMARYAMLEELGRCQVSSGLLDQIVARLLATGFFDSGLFESANVLTSVDIQARYFNAAKRRQKDAEYPHLLINVAENGINVAEMGINVTLIPQRKEKKSKEEKKPYGLKKKTAAGAAGGGGDGGGENYPCLEEVMEYFRGEGAPESLADWEQTARTFLDSYAATGWIDNRGRKVVDWKAAARRWIALRSEHEKNTKRHENNTSDRLSERRGTDAPARGTVRYTGAL